MSIWVKTLCLEHFSDVWNTDAGRFWFSHDSRKIPTIHLTDTGVYRTSESLDSFQVNRRSSVEFSTLKAVTESVLKTIKQLTEPDRDSYSQPNPLHRDEWSSSQPKNYLKLHQLFSKFLMNFSRWQKKVEKQLTNIEQSQKTSHNNNANNINLFQLHNLESTNTSTGGTLFYLLWLKSSHCTNIIANFLGEPYYVLVGHRPSNVETLNSVINDYYMSGGENHQSNNSKTQNSPMVIKLVEWTSTAKFLWAAQTV